MEGKDEAKFDIPFMIQSHVESMKKIMGALQDLPANQHSQSSPIPQIKTELAVLGSWQILKGSQDFLHTFSMALYHKWDVKNGFTYVLHFFSLISDSPGGVATYMHVPLIMFFTNIRINLSRPCYLHWNLINYASKISVCNYKPICLPTTQM